MKDSVGQMIETERQPDELLEAGRFGGRHLDWRAACGLHLLPGPPLGIP